MTEAEACAMLAEQVRATAAARAERDAMKLIAVEALAHGRTLLLERQLIEGRYLRLLDEYRAFREQPQAKARSAA